MRVVRGKTFQGKTGVWEKIEVELDSSDLLPDEQAASEHVHVQLLEVRIDKHLIVHLLRHGQLTKDEAAIQLAEIESHRNTLLKIKPKKLLRRRGVPNVE